MMASVAQIEPKNGTKRTAFWNACRFKLAQFDRNGWHGHTNNHITNFCNY